MTADDVIRFWYEEKGPSAWYASDPDLDAEIRERFGATIAAARVGELFAWRDTAAGRLAEIVVLDQFSRNMFRESARAFDADPVALVLAQEAVRLGVHEALGERKAGVLMPYMHSESKLVHEVAVRLFEGTGSLDYEIRHKAIIDRFGRYPHRNQVLSRSSTPEEEAFLAQPGSRF
jgi:uncharacterized protein (DUF924 family)